MMNESNIEQIRYMRNDAINCIELCKGFTQEQRNMNNYIETIETLAGFVLILTNEQI